MTPAQHAILASLADAAAQQGHKFTSSVGRTWGAVVSNLRPTDPRSNPRFLGAGAGLEELRVALAWWTAAGVTTRPVRGETITRDDGVTYTISAVDYPSSAPIAVLTIHRASPMP